MSSVTNVVIPQNVNILYFVQIHAVVDVMPYMYGD